MDVPHPSDEDLERYYLGLVTEESELAALEEHLLVCHACIERAKDAQNYVDAMRRGIITGKHDLDIDPEK
jgi:hypothetical protein